MIFPNDTVTLLDEINGNGSLQLTSGGNPKTVLGVDIQKTGGGQSGDAIIYCGGDIISLAYSTNHSYTFLNYQCNDNIIVSKTGQDKAFFTINYVPYLTYDLSTTTVVGYFEGYNPSKEISTSTDLNVYGAISAGELIISVLLIMMLLFKLIEMLAKSLQDITTQRQYLDYGGGEVNIRND